MGAIVDRDRDYDRERDTDKTDKDIEMEPTGSVEADVYSVSIVLEA